MAIDLLNSFLQRGQNVSTNSKSTTNTNVQNMPQNLQVMRAIKALQAGQILRGEIISVKGEEVQLAIMKDVLIEAKLATSMQLTPGTSMPFQVKVNNSNGLSLIPLFTNITADPNVMKALEMANLPVNERSMEMVQTLMEKGMPIDKQNLQETYRDVNSLKETPVKDIIALKQLQLPINQENANQLSSYENNQHYLKDTFQDIGKALANQFHELVSSGNIWEAKQLIEGLQNLFHSSQNEGRIQKENISVSTAVEEIPLEKAVVQDGKLPKTMPDVWLSEQTPKEKEAQELSKAQLEIPPKEKEDFLNKNEGRDEIEGGKQAKKENFLIQKNSWEELLNSLGKEKEIGKVSRFFEKIWNQEVKKHWMLEPELFADKKQVKSYYENLDTQIKELEKILEGTNLEKSPVAKMVQNTSANLDFMNQLNQMHAYIQLPLKMSNQNAKGELYVFSNKKNLTKQEGKVTALLHLDMEFLGKMDIYVALENSKVSTNFYLEKEEYLEFIENNMDLLTARLEKRGYSCSMKASIRNSDGEEDSVMKIIEKQQGQSVLLSTQAFDVRA